MKVNGSAPRCARQSVSVCMCCCGCGPAQTQILSGQTQTPCRGGVSARVMGGSKPLPSPLPQVIPFPSPSLSDGGFASLCTLPGYLLPPSPTRSADALRPRATNSRDETGTVVGRGHKRGRHHRHAKQRQQPQLYMSTPLGALA